MFKVFRVPVLLAVVCCAFGLAHQVTAQAVSSDEGLTATDWASIQAAYEAGRHAVQATDGGYRARNPGQQWTTSFDCRGFTTSPDACGWSWGLELASYGRAGDEQVVMAPRAVTAEGPRVSYDWNDQLTEWWVNDERGLEHGYTLHERPAGTTKLTLDLTIRGDLEATISGDGRDVHFVGAEGGTVLNYAGLTVFDSEGQVLAARFESTRTGMRLTIDDKGADYPVTIDPVAQQAYLKASNTETGDSFGSLVSTSGDTVVVGASWEDSNATGVDGNQSDNSASFAGAAYVFVRSGTSWSQQAYLKASNTDAADFFGRSVSVFGDTIVVGASEDSGATGVDGNQSDNSASFAGAAYVFVRSGTSWSQQAYLKASNTDAFDNFGASVAVSGDTVVVGASRENSGATGVNGNQGNTINGDSSGAAYVFVRTGTTWSQQAYLKASNSGMDDSFGSSVSISGDTVVVGAFREDSSATGVNGDEGNDATTESGAAYVFVRSGTNWSQQAYLKASNTDDGDEFGESVSISGDTLVVGAFREESVATGVNGDQANNSATQAGAVYVFERNGASWAQQAYLKASNTDSGDGFGQDVSIFGDTVVVGAGGEDSSATGINGNQSSAAASSSGAAYVFIRSGTSWSQLAYVKASNTGVDDFFGGSVSVSGNTVAVGAPIEGSSATGVNGAQSDNSAGNAGAVYVFDIPGSAWSNEGSALAGGTGDPVLQGTGSLAAGSSNQVDLTNAAPSATAGLFLALGPVSPAPFKGGTLKPVPFFSPIFRTTSPSGEISTPFVMPSGIPTDTELWVQWGIQDAAAPVGVALSNAIKGVTP